MEWVNIDGYKYVYQINTEGQVRWLDAYGIAHIVRPYTAGQKRTRITMTRADGVKISVAVVNLMADAFMDGRLEGYNIIHKNGCKYDNRLPNLRFATKEETAQMSLFPDEKKERSRKLDKAYDAINKKFGAATIQRGSNLQSDLRVGKKYQAQMEQKKLHNKSE